MQFRFSIHNHITAINGFAMPAVRYIAGIIHCTINDCLDLDRMTRKQITPHEALHPKVDID